MSGKKWREGWHTWRVLALGWSLPPIPEAAQDTLECLSEGKG